MPRRTDLHQILVAQTPNVYFQPPPTLTMAYPCIVYARSAADTTFANNALYIHKKRYEVTVIDRDPDSLIPDKVATLPLASFSRHFTSDNLNHDVYNVYF